MSVDKHLITYSIEIFANGHYVYIKKEGEGEELQFFSETNIFFMSNVKFMLEQRANIAILCIKLTLNILMIDQLTGWLTD
jgi:hypothetical protein